MAGRLRDQPFPTCQAWTGFAKGMLPMTLLSSKHWLWPYKYVDVSKRC